MSARSSGTAWPHSSSRVTVVVSPLSNRDLLHLDIAGQRAELAADLERAGMIRGSFTFADGEQSRTYFDKYLVLSRPAMLLRTANLMAGELPEQVDRLAATSAATS